MGIETIHWHTVHPRFLNRGSRIIDLGANFGLFSKAIIERFGCECCAVEPSPDVFASMYSHPRIRKFNLAIAERNGVANFHINEHSLSSSLLGARDANSEDAIVKTRRLDDFVQDLGWESVDLIKFDIEGAEIAVIDSLSDDFLRTLGQITIEFHDFSNLTPPSEVARVLRRLRKLGFSDVRMSRVGHQDTWLVNRERCQITNCEFLWLRSIMRNWFGARRVAKRLVNKAMGRAIQ